MINGIFDNTFAKEHDSSFGEALHLHLHDIVQSNLLTAVFQPILDMQQAKIIGYEGLIRGPATSVLHTPIELFRVARACGMVAEVEYLSRRTVLESFAKQNLSGKIFLNVSPDVLLQPDSKNGETLKYLEELGLQPNQVIIELTENAQALDYQLLRDATQHYRNMGFEIAIDDLGEGFSGLRLWSEIRPEYVKVDKHFIHNIHLDPVKMQFARSIQEIAAKSGALVIAEGIEIQDELMAIRDLGITYGQGYHIGRPSILPSQVVPTEITKSLMRIEISRENLLQNRATVEKLLKHVSPVAPTCNNEDVFKMFDMNADLYALPVVVDGRPIGLIGRNMMINDYARPYRRELYGRKPCEMMMDRSAIIVDQMISLQELSDLILKSDPRHLSIGFIITDNGIYRGMGSGHDLLRIISQMQINAARYANPLTMLPGNVPISEQIDSLLESGVSFVACYCDLDNFKPFNDVYGFKKGDEVIQLTGRLLTEVCGPYDFLGHIGGDDFIVLFQSEHWETRCEEFLSKVSDTFPQFYTSVDQQRGGIETEDRQGERRFHSILSISIGALIVEPDHYPSHHEVSAACVNAKKQAKKIPGNNLFIERRTENNPEVIS
ncbi:GGDEF domain-containing protein [Methylotenera sp.]|uniref:GGDEF domain-containing protein n=1 Tax=Methylotenera sp. TaxID=2051956 RepID=UPI0024885978|nr:GGDEF domain-containing protein [Methylotenera sp.]MDI1363184.1 GGDEF domain-containing protein [Methylotenera sp.]